MKESSLKRLIIEKIIKKNNLYYLKTRGDAYNLGHPDIITIVNGFFIGLELKSDDVNLINGLSDIQKYNLIKISKNGGIGACSNKYSAVEDLINAISRSKSLEFVKISISKTEGIIIF